LRALKGIVRHWQADSDNTVQHSLQAEHLLPTDYLADGNFRWRAINQHWPGPNTVERDWLLTPGSLTRRLLSISAGTFEVRVLEEGWVYRTVRVPGFSSTIATKQIMWSRQVILGGFGESWVAAHTLIPVSSLKGQQRRLLMLGNRPLGGFLFRQASLRRAEAQICHINNVWGRRSLFFVEDRPLLVAEFFLPDLLRRYQQPV
jgi:chorismate lyase